LIYEITISCGIGDAITYLARLDSLLKRFDMAKFKIVGGYDGIPDMIRELVGRDPRVISCDEEVKFCKKLDWRPSAVPLAYPIRLPHWTPYSKEALGFAKDTLSSSKKSCVVHPITSTGNNRGFEEYRYWEMEKWVDLIKRLNSRYDVFQIGSKEDSHDFEGTKNLCGEISIDESIALVSNANLFVGTNSWPGLVSAYALVSTVYMYFVDHQTIPLQCSICYFWKIERLVLIKSGIGFVDEM
jgi:hypothetical protein